MPDIHDTNAAIAGEAAGLRPEQWPGLAHLLRATAAKEREACEKIADKQALICFDGNITERTAVASAIADAIRARADQE